MAQLGLIRTAGNLKSSYECCDVNGIKTAANGMSGAGGFIGSIGDWLGGAVANAKGGVYTSANLSAYSNSIVDTPTYFAFAKGPS